MDDGIYIRDRETGEQFQIPEKSEFTVAESDEQFVKKRENEELEFETEIKDLPKRLAKEFEEDFLRRYQNPMLQKKKSGRFYWPKKSRNSARAKRR